MATQSTVTGPVQTPFGATPDRGYIRFQLTDWDAEGGTVITTTAVEEPIDVDTQDFSASLWASSEGDRGVNYKVTAVWYYETVDKWVEDQIGYCEVGTSGPYALGDILVDDPIYPADIDYATAAATSAAEAAASAADAESAVSEVEDIKDATALIAQTQGAYTDTTIAAAIASGVSALTVGDTFTATGDDVDYIGLYVIETGPVATEIATLPKSEYSRKSVRFTARRDTPEAYLIALQQTLGEAIARISSVESELKILRSSSSVIYCDSTATGAADGTSWDDAYTDLQTAFEAATAGDIVLTNAPESNPFSTCSATITPGFIWVSNLGPDGVTWVSGAISAGSSGEPSTWVDEGSGVYSIVPSSTPLYCAYDFKRDTVTGSVTGVDLTQSDFADAIEKWGRDPDDLVAWYGFLEESGTETTTPTEGYWSYTGGTLYVHPPSGAALSNVNDLAIWSYAIPGAVNFVTVGDVNGPIKHSGNLVTHFTPAVDDGVGYGVRYRYAEDACIEDVLSIACGYHAVGMAGNSTVRNTIRNCVSVGGCGTGNPFVFYTNQSYDIPDAGHVGDNLIYVSAPYLKHDGTPLDASYAGQARLGYSHSAGTYSLGGITWSRCLGIDPSQQIAANGFTLGGTPTMRFVGCADTPDDFDQYNEASFAVKVIDSVGLGQAFGPEVNISHHRCTFDCMGGEQTGFSWQTNPDWWFLRLVDSRLTIKGVSTNGVPYSQIADGKGSVALIGSDIQIESAGTQGIFQFVATVPSEAVILKDSTFNHATTGGALITCVNSIDEADIIAAQSIVSLGGNVLGDNMSSVVRNSSGSVIISAESYLQNFDADNLDFAMA